MKCINHPDRDAVANCQTCGKGLCQECAELIKPIPQCVSCFKNDLTVEKREIIKSLAISTLVGIILMVICINNAITQGEPEVIFSSILFLGVGFGWSALNKITPNIFLFMSWFGWICYFVIKLFLAALIGIFVCPFKVISSLKRIKDINTQLQSV